MGLERTMSSKGQIVIPMIVRKKLGLKTGSEVIFEIEDGKIVVKRKMTSDEIVRAFSEVPKKIKKLNSEKIKKMLDEEYEIHWLQYIHICCSIARRSRQAFKSIVKTLEFL